MTLGEGENMNREIKFRAYSSDMGEWYYGSFIDLYEDDFCYIKSDDCEHFKFADRETLGQYTGLKDKNGVDIYEGDIIQFKHYYASKRWWRTTSEISDIEKEVQKQREDYRIEKENVTFDNGCFKLGYGITGSDLAMGEKFRKGSTHSCDYEERYWDFEVIGNIHENSELVRL